MMIPTALSRLSVAAMAGPKPSTASSAVQASAPGSAAVADRVDFSERVQFSGSGKDDAEMLRRLERDMKRLAHEPEFLYQQLIDKDARHIDLSPMERFLKPNILPQHFFRHRLQALTYKQFRRGNEFDRRDALEMDFLQRVLGNHMVQTHEDQALILTYLAVIPFVDTQGFDLFATLENQLVEEFQGYTDKADSQKLAQAFRQRAERGLPIFSPDERKTLNAAVQKINAQLPVDCTDEITPEDLKAVADKRVRALQGLEDLLRYTDPR